MKPAATPVADLVDVIVVALGLGVIVAVVGGGVRHAW